MIADGFGYQVDIARRIFRRFPQRPAWSGKMGTFEQVLILRKSAGIPVTANASTHDPIMPETKSAPEDALATPDPRKPFVAPEVTELEKLQTLTMLQGVTLEP